MRPCQWSNFASRKEEVNAALAESIPVSMKRTGLELAIDFHDEPCYAKQEALQQVTCSGKAKQGTTHFIRTASAYVIWRQVRLTLAVRYVLPAEETLHILQRLLAPPQSHAFQFQGSYTWIKALPAVLIITYLTDQKQPTIIACPIRGKSGGTKSPVQRPRQLSYRLHLYRWYSG